MVSNGNAIHTPYSKAAATVTAHWRCGVQPAASIATLLLPGPAVPATSWISCCVLLLLCTQHALWTVRSAARVFTCL